MSSKYGFYKASFAPILFFGLNSSIYFNKLRPCSSVAGYISLRSIGSHVLNIFIYFFAISSLMKSRSSSEVGVPIT